MQDHRVLILWAFDLAQETLIEFKNSYPLETRPLLAFDAAQKWAQGKIKMREAQRRILDCHALAKELTSMDNTIGRDMDKISGNTGFSFMKVSFIIPPSQNML